MFSIGTVGGGIHVDENTEPRGEIELRAVTGVHYLMTIMIATFPGEVSG